MEVPCRRKLRSYLSRLLCRSASPFDAALAAAAEKVPYQMPAVSIVAPSTNLLFIFSSFPHRLFVVVVVVLPLPQEKGYPRMLFPLRLRRSLYDGRHHAPSAC